MQLPLNVLILCTGNSCRSIIGEALVSHLGAGKLRGLSAGSHPTGEVNPGALAVLSRHGIAIQAPWSKSMEDLRGERIDLVISVCDSAAGEACPLWLEAAPRVHWGIPDPAHVTGNAETIRTAFETTYQQLHQRISALVALDLARLTASGLAEAAQNIHAAAAQVND